MKKSLLYTIGLGVLALSSCTKVIEVDLNTEENKRLVVDAQFSSYAQEHIVKLGESANFYSSDEPTLISGATVKVTEGTNTFDFNEVSPGVYQSNNSAVAEIGKEYTLSIDYAGKTYTGKDYCDYSPTVDTVILEPNYVDGSTTEIEDYTIRFSTQEAPGFGDYYAWKIYVNGVLRNDSVPEQLSQSDEFLPDGTYLYEVELTYIDDVESGDTITVAQHAISKEIYDAVFAIRFQTDFRGGIFDSPPANVPTNMSDGAVGLFSVSGETRNFAIVP
ncbi:MAG: DUF4249 domain-containing protein [Flavobacteriales bacterium]|jgi:hypothetical protein|nr:DUF4249 domain-containing protein [Flavobacteriales bacterium]